MARRSSRTAAARAAAVSPSRSTRSKIDAPRPKLGYGKERRIRRRADFLRVQSHGERATSKHYVFLVTAGEPPAGPSRLGIVATKKVGDAVMRNRIKRVCRECFRQWPDFVPAGIDLVVIAREGAHALTLSQAREEWTRARSPLLKACAKATATRAK